MNNKKLVAGIAAGAAALALTAVLFSREKSKKKAYKKQVAEAKDNMHGKLNELQRKAEKEYKNAPQDDAKHAVNAAKERANDWADKASHN